MDLPDGPRGRALAIGLTLAAAALVWIGLVQPLIDWHDARDDALEQARARLAREDSLIAALPALRRAAEGASSAPGLTLLDGTSDAVAGATLQSTVVDLARTARIDITRSENVPAEQRGNLRRIGLRVVLNAPWPAFVSLLGTLAHASPAMSVDDVTLRDQNTIQADQRQVDATMTVYAFRQGTEAP